MKKKKDTKKACLREFIDRMNARLKKYDIAAKLPRGNGDIEFIFGKTWGSALKNRLAAYNAYSCTRGTQSQSTSPSSGRW